MPLAEWHFFTGKRDKRTQYEAKERLLNVGKIDKDNNGLCFFL